MTFRTSSSGRSYFCHIIAQIQVDPPPPSTATDEITQWKAALDSISSNIQELRAMTSKGVAVYNPFLARSMERPSPSVVKSLYSKQPNSTRVTTNNNTKEEIKGNNSAISAPKSSVAEFHFVNEHPPQIPPQEHQQPQGDQAQIYFNSRKLATAIAKVLIENKQLYV